MILLTILLGLSMGLWLYYVIRFFQEIKKWGGRYWEYCVKLNICNLIIQVLNIIIHRGG